MRRILYLLALPALWIAYFLSGLFPRRADLAVVGAPKDAFGDNSKHFFLDAAGQGYSIVWITGRRSVLAQCAEAGAIARMRWSFGGMYACLRAQTYVVSCYVNDVNFWLSRGARVCNLWHGVPLKKIERAVSRGKVAERFSGPLWKRTIYALAAPHVYRKPDRLLAPAPGFREIFEQAFAVGRDAITIASYPRNRPLIEAGRGPRRTAPTPTQYRQMFGLDARPGDRTLHMLYAPTWRDHCRDFSRSCPIDWQAMNDRLEALDARMTIRLHPASTFSGWKGGLSRVWVQEAGIDIYPLLPMYDVLVTDYSSIYFDFLLLDRPMIFFAYDLESYASDVRGLYFRYGEMVPGPVAATTDDLLEEVAQSRFDRHREARRTLMERLQTAQPPLEPATWLSLPN